MASVALQSNPPIPAVILLTLCTTTIACTIAITSLLGLLIPLWIMVLPLCPCLRQFPESDAIQGVHLLLLCFVEVRLHGNLLQFVSQWIDLVAHQLGEKPPIMISRYTFQQVMSVCSFASCHPDQSNCLSQHIGWNHSYTTGFPLQLPVHSRNRLA